MSDKFEWKCSNRQDGFGFYYGETRRGDRKGGFVVLPQRTTRRRPRARPLYSRKQTPLTCVSACDSDTKRRVSSESIRDALDAMGHQQTSVTTRAHE